MDYRYNSALLSLTPHSTPDPFCVYANGSFYLTYTTNDHIQIWRAKNLQDFMTTRDKTIVWRPRPDSDNSQGIWAPELHALDGRWYILYCAEHPRIGNASHRLFILGGPPSTQDPCMDVSTGVWQDLGHVQGMRTDQWAIDGTYFTVNNTLYMVYAGSPVGQDPARFSDSLLHIVRMNSPMQCGSQPVPISAPTHDWEREGWQGINEGPEWLEAPDGSWKGLVYSAGGSWCNRYKMVVLHYRQGGDPLDPRSWSKQTDKPLLVSAKGRHGPYGPGHGNFIHLGQETLAIFHATDRPDEGWENRRARCQRVAWTGNGPVMGDGHVGVRVDNIQAFTRGVTTQQVEAAQQQSKLHKFGEKYRKYTSGW